MFVRVVGKRTSSAKNCHVASRKTFSI